MSKLRYFFQESWLLMVSSVVFGGLLAATNSAWEPRIRQNEIDKFNALAGAMLPQAIRFEAIAEKVSVDLGKGKTAQVEVKRGLTEQAQTAGWAFVCEGSGFADKIKLVVATDAGFAKLAGFGVLSSNETPGFGDKITIKNGFFQSQFKGAPADLLTLVRTGDRTKIDSEIVAISGATVTSQAVVDILNRFISQVKQGLEEKGVLQ